MTWARAGQCHVEEVAPAGRVADGGQGAGDTERAVRDVMNRAGICCVPAIARRMRSARQWPGKAVTARTARSRSRAATAASAMPALPPSNLNSSARRFPVKPGADQAERAGRSLAGGAIAQHVVDRPQRERHARQGRSTGRRLLRLLVHSRDDRLGARGQRPVRSGRPRSAGNPQGKPHDARRAAYNDGYRALPSCGHSVTMPGRSRAHAPPRAATPARPWPAPRPSARLVPFSAVSHTSAKTPVHGPFVACAPTADLRKHRWPPPGRSGEGIGEDAG